MAADNAHQLFIEAQKQLKDDHDLLAMNTLRLAAVAAFISMAKSLERIDTELSLLRDDIRRNH